MIGCRTIQPSPGAPKFVFNGRTNNSAIVVKAPVGNNTDCFIQHEFLLDLKTFDGKAFYGIVQDSKSLDSLPLVTIQVLFSDSSTQTIVTDKKGTFEIDNLLPTQGLSVSFVGYEELIIDLREFIKIRH
jgi:hypothetical protein